MKLAKSESTASDRAAATFERLLKLDPTWGPDTDLYPPATQAFVAKLRAKNQKKSTRVGLTVSTRPSGLPVFVGGKSIGLSPQTILVPIRSSYLVEVQWAEGRRGLARTVTIEDQLATIELDKAFEGSVYPDSVCVLTDGSRKGRLAIASRIKALLGVQTLHAVREEEPATDERYVTAVTLNAAGEERVEARIKLRTGGLTPAVWDTFVSFMLSGAKALPPVEVIQPVPPSITPTPVAASVPIATSSTLDEPRSGSAVRAAAIATGALGLVAAGATVYLGLQANTASTKLAQLCPGGHCLPSDSAAAGTLDRAGNANTTFAIVAGSAAGVALGVSLVLFVVSGRGGRAAEPGPPAALSIEPTPSGFTVRF